jgi:hypothetical protein
MSHFYIQDSTINRFVYFDTVPQLVEYLSTVTLRAYNLSRSQYTQNLAELGYGPDDREGVTFTRALSEQFNIGVLTADGKHVKTDVHTIVNFTGEAFSDNANNRYEERGRL